MLASTLFRRRVFKSLDLRLASRCFSTEPDRELSFQRIELNLKDDPLLNETFTAFEYDGQKIAVLAVAPYAKESYDQVAKVRIRDLLF
jgi:hypothetical protein